MDGLTVDGNAELSSTNVRLDLFESDTTDLNTRFRHNGGSLLVRTTTDDGLTDTTRMSIDHATGDISFYEDTGSSPKFYWDASAESLGIGTSSPSAKLEINGATRIKNDNKLEWHNGFGLVSGAIMGSGAGYLNFFTGGSERMRIDSSGNLLVGTTTSINLGDTTGNGFQVNSGGQVNMKRTCTTSTQGLLHLNNIGTEGQVIEFYQDGGQVGNISVTGSSTAYNTSSDYRLKEDWQPVANASDRVAQLKPVNFAWKVDGTRVDGFLAHELAEVIPEAVTGEKDAMRTEEYEVTPAVLDDEGNVVTEAVMGTREVPDYQGIDQSKLVPLLTAALQEALTEIDNLKARLDAAGI
jgi:hypothetical protein